MVLTLQTTRFRSRLARSNPGQLAEAWDFRRNATGKKNGEIHHIVRRP